MILASMNKMRIYISIFLVLFLLGSCSKAKKVPLETHFWGINSFSPNNDGLNDTFGVLPRYGVDIPEFHISIYNDNLQLIYQSNDLYASWAPGTNEASTPTGNYLYQIIYTASADSINYDSYITSSEVYLHR